MTAIQPRPDVTGRHLQPAAPPSAAALLFGPREVLSLGAGDRVYGQGDRAVAVYRVESGLVRVYRLLADGRRQITAFCLAGEVFGFEADGEHHFFAEAVGDTVVKVFRKPLDAAASAALLPEALKALVRAQEHLLAIGRQSAQERLAGFLLDMQSRQQGCRDLDLRMTREDIGDYLGMTIETVSRCFSRFRAQRLIRLASVRSVQIIDGRALAELCA